MLYIRLQTGQVWISHVTHDTSLHCMILAVLYERNTQCTLITSSHTTHIQSIVIQQCSKLSPGVQVSQSTEFFQFDCLCEDKNSRLLSILSVISTLKMIIDLAKFFKSSLKSQKLIVPFVLLNYVLRFLAMLMLSPKIPATPDSSLHC